MLIGYLPARYLWGMGAWLVILAGLLVQLLWLRKRSRRRPWMLTAINVGLSAWMMLLVVTGAELYFALFVAESDTLNVTNVAQRWWDIHIRPQLSENNLRSRYNLAEPLKPGTQCIAFLGDSFTFGHGVPRMEDRFTDLVSAALNRAHPDGFRVDNLGVPGDDVMEVAKHIHAMLDMGYRPTMFIYVLQINDMEQIDPQTWNSTKRMIKAQPQFFLLKDTYFLNWLYYRLRRGSGGAATDYFTNLAAAYDGPAWTSMTHVLDEIHHECTEHGVGFRLVIFPFVHNLGPAYPFHRAHEKLMNYAKDRGIRALDLEPVLAPHADETLVVSGLDAHPNERAHALAAEAIEAHLLDDLMATGAGAAK